MLSEARVGLFLEAAVSIGERLRRRAVRSGASATWEIVTVDRGSPMLTRGTVALAGPTLYDGTAGIALYLIELHRFAPLDWIESTARAGLEFAVAESERMAPTRFGFHSGRVGLAYALARASVRFGDPILASRATKILEPTWRREGEDSGGDVIAGAAGAIPILLDLARTLENPAIQESAFALAEKLCTSAQHGPAGWSWRSSVDGHVRPLTGLAHGAAGYAHALVETYRASGRGEHRFGAMQAIAYEQLFFDDVAGNWPDFRHAELAKFLLSPDGVDELRSHLASGGDAPAFHRGYMTSWCHGAPGIGLARLWAYRVLGLRGYRDQAEAAIRTTLANLRGTDASYTLCHGILGNAELLVEASRLLGKAELFGVVAERAEEGVRRFELGGRPWISGSYSAPDQPTLMLGDAGIGYALLRLIDDSVPSVLLPRFAVSSEPEVALNDLSDAAAQDAKAWFGRSLRVAAHLGVDTANVVDQARQVSELGEPLIPALARALTEATYAADEVVSEWLTDAILPELTRFNADLSNEDHSIELIERLMRPPWQSLRLSQCEFTLSSHVTTISSRWDWDSWLKGNSSIAPVESRKHFVVFRRHNAHAIVQTSSFAAVILAALSCWQTVDSLVTYLAENTLSDESTEGFRLHVLEQLKRAYEAGCIRVRLEVAADEGRDRPFASTTIGQ